MESTPKIRIGATLTRESLRELAELGFSTIPGPLAGHRLAGLVEAYDKVMSKASGHDFNAGSTADRMSDLLNFSQTFDEVFLHKPLLEACSHIIGERFKLSSFLGRTVRAGTRAQELHADLPRTSPDAPLLGFILMMILFGRRTVLHGSSRDHKTGLTFPAKPCSTLGRRIRPKNWRVAKLEAWWSSTLQFGTVIQQTAVWMSDGPFRAISFEEMLHKDSTFGAACPIK